MASDEERVKNGEPVGAGQFNGGQKALGPGKPKNGNGNGNGHPKNKGLTRLPSQPQDHFQDRSTGSSGDQARDLEKIVNGNGGPRGGSSSIKGSGISVGPGAGTVGRGQGPSRSSTGGKKKQRRQRGGPRWSPGDDPNGGNGNGGPSGGPTPGSGPSYSGPSGAPGPGSGPSSGPSAAGGGNGNGGNGGPRHHTTFYGPPANGNGDSAKQSKVSRKGRNPLGFVGGYFRGRREEHEKEERLARPIAEEIARQQFGIYEDPTQVTHYTVLGIPRDADQSLIESVYQAKLDHLRPENNTSQEAIDELKLVKEAYAVLSNPVKRKAYDRSLDYTRMSSRMQKKAMGQARTGMKYEQEIKNQAKAMGIPLIEEKSKTIQLGSMSQGEMRAWAIQNGLGEVYDRDPRTFRGTYKTVEVTEKQRVKRSVQELSQAIGAQKAALQAVKTLAAEQEDEYKELRPGKVTKVSRKAGQAAAGGFKLAGQVGAAVGKSSARSGIGREVRGQGRADLGSLRDIQAPALGAIRRAGVGGVKRRQGALKVESPFGKLPTTGKLERRRKKGF